MGEVLKRKRKYPSVDITDDYTELRPRRPVANAINVRGGASRRCHLPKLIKHAVSSVAVVGGYAELGRGFRCLRTVGDACPYNVIIKPSFHRSPWRAVLFKGSLREAMIKSKIHRRGELRVKSNIVNNLCKDMVYTF